MDLRALAKSSVLYAIGNLALRLVGFLMIPVYTRFLTTADYGLIELIDLVVTVSAIAFGLTAMGTALIRIYHDNKDREWQDSVISSGILFMGGGSALIALIGIAAAPWISQWALGSSQYTVLLQATFAALVASTMVEICLTYLRIKDRPLHFVMYSLAQLAVALTLNIYLIAFLGYGVWGFVISKVVSSGLGALYLLLLTFREVGIKWNREAVSRMLRFGSPIIIAALASFSVHFLDRFILRFSDSLAAVGIYALAYKFGFMITHLVATPFHRAWNTRLYAHTDEPGWEKRFSSILGAFVFVLLFGWLGLSALIDEALVIMADPAYHGALVFVPWIALGYASRSVGDFFRTILYINKRSWLTTKIGVSGALLNLGLNLWLIPLYAAWGATWATLATWAYFMTVSWFMAQREHRLPLPYRSMATMLAIALGLYGLSRVLAGGPLPLGIGVSLALALAFPPLAWLLGCFSPSQKETVRGLWARRRNLRKPPQPAEEPQPEAKVGS